MSNSYSSEEDYKKRLRLIQTLNRLPISQFEEAVYVLKVPPGILPPALAPQAIRSVELLNWLESPGGPRLTALQDVLRFILTPPNKLVEVDCPYKGPYKGLSYFDYNDRDYKYFHGRELLTQSLLNQVDGSNFTAIVGASGSGKSSLLRVGLLQQLKQDNRYEIRLLAPGSNPLQSLASAFVNKLESQLARASQQEQAEALLNKGSDGLRRLVQNSDSQKVILAIEQFEEVFTLCQSADLRQRFFETLLNSLESLEGKLHIVLTMRSDFIGYCFEQNYSGLSSYVEKSLVVVLPMNRPDLARAITDPAKSMGLEVEPELVKQLLDDIENSPGSLPLLQYTLKELWEQQNQDLTLKAYVQIGGISSALQKRADQVYETLTVEQKEAARHIFLSLTQPGENVEDTRRRVSRTDLEGSQFPATTIATVIKKLADANLIVTSEEIGVDGDRVPIVDVAHETLIRHWDRLKNWLQDNREAISQQRRIENSAKDWIRKNKAKDYLLQGIKLEEAKDYLKSYANTLGLSSQAQDFVRESRYRQRTYRFSLACLILSIFSLSAFSWQNFSEYRFQVQYTSVLIGEEASPELLHILPKALRAANYQKNRGNLNTAVEAYKSVLIVSNHFSEAIRAENTRFLKSDHQKVERVAEISEEHLAELVELIYLPELEADLKISPFGKLIADSKLTDFEKRYTEGALKKTYEILMRKPGLNADTNNNGLLDVTEKNLIPCKTLKEIERLWRNATNNRCGFYGENKDFYIAEDCSELENYTLTERIFLRPLGPAIDRLKECEV